MGGHVQSSKNIKLPLRTFTKETLSEPRLVHLQNKKSNTCHVNTVGSAVASKMAAGSNPILGPSWVEFV